MYTRAQKESSSTSPTFSIPKKSNNCESSHSFSVQRQPEINSSQEKERPSYSRNAADLLAANVMRSMEARQQGEEAQGATSVTEVVMPKPELPIAPAASVFQPLGNMGIQRQCSACEQAMEDGKDSDEMSLVAGVQTKLTVGAVGDKYEQEADRVAAQVMRMSVAPDNSPQVQRFGEEDNPVQRWSLAQSITPVVHRRVDEQLQMHQLVQRAFQAGGNQASGDLESRLNASKGGGSALAPEVRAFMEPRFGADFSSVRVHTGGEAVQMNRELGAQAFAHGSDVYFGAGKSPGNNELTAHELTHVVQQNGATNSPIQRQCGVDESCVEEPNASYPEPNYTPATPEANASYPNKVLHGEAHYTPADANMSTPDGTEVYFDAPLQQTDTDTTTDVESQAETPSYRPNIHHDHGFLDDGHGNIDETKRRAPEFSDYAALAWWETKLNAAEVLRPDLIDGTAAYRHFLFGNGATRTIDYERFIANDPSGQIIITSAVRDIVDLAREHHNQFIQANPGSTEAQTFNIHTDAIPVGGTEHYPYPATENWQKAIGAHIIWLEGSVTVNINAADNTRSFEIEMTLHMEDMYNFNPGAADIATGSPDSANGRFEVTGLGHEYLNTAVVHRTITSPPEPMNTASSDSSNPQVDGPRIPPVRTPDDGRGTGSR